MDLSMSGSTDKLVAAENLSRTVAATGVIHRAYTIPEAETALDMSGISTAGYFVAVNVSGTGLIQIAAAAGETALVNLYPGDVCCFKIHTDATAPVTTCDAASTVIEYLLFEA